MELPGRGGERIVLAMTATKTRALIEVMMEGAEIRNLHFDMYRVSIEF